MYRYIITINKKNKKNMTSTMVFYIMLLNNLKKIEVHDHNNNK